VSRIGRLPVAVPAGVQVNVNGNEISVKGPKGELKRKFPQNVEVKLDGNTVLVSRISDDPAVRAMHGTARALINNMVVGVSTGFSKVLEIEGVGYRVEMEGNNAILYVGYSHPVTVEPPSGISFDVDQKTRQLKIMGFDVEQVGQIAADIRKVRPPEPYKGKGIHYLGEKIRRKAGKTGKGK
jgi:large subunit ribosomal protein L6